MLSCCSLDYEGLRVVYHVFYKALTPLYKTARKGDKHQLHLFLPSANLKLLALCDYTYTGQTFN